MIYRREEYFDENPDDQKYPVKQVEQWVSLDGNTRKFIGRVSLGIQTPMGMQTLPVTFEIAAKNVSEAFALFNAKADQEVEVAKKELQEELNEMRRRSANRIVTPGDMPPGDFGKLKL